MNSKKENEDSPEYLFTGHSREMTDGKSHGSRGGAVARPFSQCDGEQGESWEIRVCPS